MTATRADDLRRFNEDQPEGVDAWGFPVGQFACELDELRRANAAVYAAARERRGGAVVTQRAKVGRR